MAMLNSMSINHNSILSFILVGVQTENLPPCARLAFFIKDNEVTHWIARDTFPLTFWVGHRLLFSSILVEIKVIRAKHSHILLELTVVTKVRSVG